MTTAEKNELRRLRAFRDQVLRTIEGGRAHEVPEDIHHKDAYLMGVRLATIEIIELDAHHTLAQYPAKAELVS